MFLREFSRVENMWLIRFFPFFRSEISEDITILAISFRKNGRLHGPQREVNTDVSRVDSVYCRLKSRIEAICFFFLENGKRKNTVPIFMARSRAMQ